MNKKVIVITRQISNLSKRNISCGILPLKERTVVDLLKFSRECTPLLVIGEKKILTLI